LAASSFGLYFLLILHHAGTRPISPPDWPAAERRSRHAEAHV
jgi:hypothetical protein